MAGKMKNCSMRYSRMLLKGITTASPEIYIYNVRGKS